MGEVCEGLVQDVSGSIHGWAQIVYTFAACSSTACDLVTCRAGGVDDKDLAVSLERVTSDSLSTPTWASWNRREGTVHVGDSDETYFN